MASRFSRKDYVSTADMLFNNVTDRDQLAVLVAAFGDMYAADNPKFDRALFVKACGGLDEVD
jgi:hypothetical protein